MAQQSNWVSFRKIKNELSITTLLEHYNVDAKIRGDQAYAHCPLPDHEGGDTTASFSANLKRGVWQCFGCGTRGNVLEFAARMEGVNPSDYKELRRIALWLDREFLGERQRTLAEVKPPESKAKQGGQKRQKSSATAASAAAKPQQIEGRSEAEPKRVINAPLDFELKDLDPEHPYLKQRGFTRETAEHFGIGYCKRGMMNGRIAIPIHNPQGELVGYAGRLVDDDAISEDNPKYLLPGTREREGVRYEFHKSLLLYNAHRIAAPVDRLIVVEGFTDCWWLWQCGYTNVVALMGASCSDDQARLITELVRDVGGVLLLPDGDAAGIECATKCLPTLARKRLVQWLPLKETEPGQLTEAYLQRFLAHHYCLPLQP